MPSQSPRTLTRAARAFVLAIAFAPAAFAQTFPSKPLRLVTALPAGNDAYVRILATRLTEQMGQPAVVENRTGGSFVPPVQAVSTAPPDGHSLLVFSLVMVLAKNLQPSLQMDPINDVAHVAKIYDSGGGMLLVRPDSSFKSVQDLVSRAKAEPGKLSFGGQIAGFGHLNASSFLAIAGAQAFHIPYKAPGDDMPALLRGDIDFSFIATTLAMPQVQAGKFRVLAVTSANRMRSLPDAPTLVELFKNDLLAQENWTGLSVTAKTPVEVITRLNVETNKALGDAGLRKVIQAGGNEPSTGSTPEQFATFIRRENEKWAQIVKLSGAKPE